MAIPSFSNSPWIRGAPQRQFSAAMRRIRSRYGESIHGLPGRRERRRQHRCNPSRCQRSTVAGWTSTSASRHRGHNHRKNSQSRRSAGRKRRFERARTPSWWRRARVSSRRSLRVAGADRTAARVLKTSRIGCRVPTGDANVNDFGRTRYWRGTVVQWTVWSTISPVPFAIFDEFRVFGGRDPGRHSLAKRCLSGCRSPLHLTITYYSCNV